MDDLSSTSPKSADLLVEPNAGSSTVDMLKMAPFGEHGIRMSPR